MFNEVFYDKNDLVQAYADKRIALEKRDVAELLNILIKFLHRDTKTQNQYAYDIPKIGVMYKKFENEIPNKTKDTKNTRLDEMMIEMMIGENGEKIDSPLTVKKSKEELQQWQNSGE